MMQQEALQRQLLMERERMTAASAGAPHPSMMQHANDEFLR